MRLLPTVALALALASPALAQDFQLDLSPGSLVARDLETVPVLVTASNRGETTLTEASVTVLLPDKIDGFN